MKAHLLIVLCCLIPLSAFSKKKEKELTTPADSLGYAFGLLNGTETMEGLQNMPFAIDFKTFAQGFEASFFTDSTKRSYEMGYIYGCQMKDQVGAMNQQGVAADSRSFYNALQTLLNHAEPAIGTDRAEQIWRAAMNDFRERKMKEEAENNLAAGRAFLAQKETEPGVKKSASGLLYKVIKEGSGDPITLDCKVKAHYTGKLIDGTKFDSSYDRKMPLEFMPASVIKGWTEALQLMRPGSKYILYIPAELAYGETGSGGAIPPNSALEFEVEIVDVLRP